MYPIPILDNDSYPILSLAVAPYVESGPRPWFVVDALSGEVSTPPNPNLPLPKLVTTNRWFAVDGSTVTAIDTTTWQVVSTTDVGCPAEWLRGGGGDQVVAVCDSGRLVGLSDT